MPFPVHPHMLRHGCGYALANAGHDTRAETEDGPLKEQFQKQAEAYRKLAEKRAIQIGFRKPPPQLPQSHPSS
jgi:hypothetical protein